jgi:hypothetical protein
LRRRAGLPPPGRWGASPVSGGGPPRAPAHDSNPMQTFYRDMTTATHHAMLDFDATIEIQGKSLLAVAMDDAFV